MPLRSSMLRLVLRAAFPLLAFPLAGAAQQPDSTAAVLRRMYFQQDFEGGARAGGIARSGGAGGLETAAWHAVLLTRADEQKRALALADSLVAAWPASAWSHLARAVALAYAEPDENRDPEALAEMQEARRLAPSDRWATWVSTFVLNNQRQYRAVIALADSAYARDPWAEWLVIRGNAQISASYPSKPGGMPDTLLQAAGLASFEEARARDPENVNGYASAGAQLLARRQAAEALPLLRRALELAPYSAPVHSNYWRAVGAQRELTEEAKRAQVLADADALYQARRNYPKTLFTLTTAYRDAKAWDRLNEVEERILREFPGSVQEDWVLVYRFRTLSDSIRNHEVADTVAAKQRWVDQMWAFVSRPKVAYEPLLGDTYLQLLGPALADSTLPPERWLQVVQGVAKYNHINPHTTYSMGPLALADRGIYLKEAEAIVREGLVETPKYVQAQYTDPTDRAQALRWLQAIHYDALGWVLYRQGKTGDALKQLDKALDAQPNHAPAMYHRGRIAEAQGKLGDAEKWYAKGRRFETMGKKSNTEGLRALYQRQHGSLEGYDAYAGALDEKDRDTRWQHIVESRVKKPRPLPAFSLEQLAGGTFQSGALQGKIAVINFWGVWCGPCVYETPELQKFHERMQADSSVRFITISNDMNPQDVREFMAKRKLSFPVLLDAGFVSRAGINAFPTTWFADADGRIQFEHRGASDVVLEEFLWRVELLKGSKERRPITN